jgi:hypothetical protein
MGSEQEELLEVENNSNHGDAAIKLFSDLIIPYSLITIISACRGAQTITGPFDQTFRFNSLANLFLCP